MKQKTERRTKTICITVPVALLPHIQRMALEAGRSVSGYLSWLVTQEDKRLKLKGHLSDIIQ